MLPPEEVEAAKQRVAEKRLPCPTCGGKRWLRAPVPHDEVLPGRSCPDCTDGVWTPPAHPVTIGVTSATADAMLDQDERMHEAGYDIGLSAEGGSDGVPNQGSAQ